MSGMTQCTSCPLYLTSYTASEMSFSLSWSSSVFSVGSLVFEFSSSPDFSRSLVCFLHAAVHVEFLKLSNDLLCLCVSSPSHPFSHAAFIMSQVEFISNLIKTLQIQPSFPQQMWLQLLAVICLVSEQLLQGCCFSVHLC